MVGMTASGLDRPADRRGPGAAPHAEASVSRPSLNGARAPAGRPVQCIR